jgi:hypothetical protein
VRDLAYKTSHPFVTIHYPFHPLTGQRLRPALHRRVPPCPVFVFEFEEQRLSVPVWMTEEIAAGYVVGNAPVVSIQSLLELAALVHDELIAIEVPGPKLAETPEDLEDADHGSFAETAFDTPPCPDAASTPTAGRAASTAAGDPRGSRPKSGPAARAGRRGTRRGGGDR